MVRSFSKIIFNSFVLLYCACSILHSYSGDDALTNSWLFWLFALVVISAFIIFWLAQNEFIDLAFLQTKKSRSKRDEDLVLDSELENLPPAKVSSGFFEVSTENKPVADDSVILSQMKSKINSVKQSGVLKPKKEDEKVSAIVDEILEEEFNKRRPEFRGETKPVSILQTQTESSQSLDEKSPSSSQIDSVSSISKNIQNTLSGANSIQIPTATSVSKTLHLKKSHKNSYTNKRKHASSKKIILKKKTSNISKKTVAKKSASKKYLNKKSSKSNLKNKRVHKKTRFKHR